MSDEFRADLLGFGYCPWIERNQRIVENDNEETPFRQFVPRDVRSDRRDRGVAPQITRRRPRKIGGSIVDEATSHNRLPLAVLGDYEVSGGQVINRPTVFVERRNIKSGPIQQPPETSVVAR